MKRILTTFVVIGVLASATSALATGEPYTWTISSSSSDAFANTGTFTPGLGTVYLWLACCDLPDPNQDGMAAAEFELTNSNAANVLLAVTPQNNFLNAGTGAELLLAVGGCPCGPIVAASALVLNNAPGQWCLAPSTTNGIKGTVDCEPLPNLWPIAWIGLANDGLTICAKGEACKEPPTSVEESSFGQIKGLYR